MFPLLLAVIYLAFISLGLPDSLLGSTWPVMYQEFSVPVSYAGFISMIIAAGTIVSSLQTDRLTKRLGTGKVTAFSVLTTAAALFGFSISHSFPALCLWAIPYGLGAGCVDASLNNYVALHYSSRHMSWLHCMWGVGASLGPYIMGFALTGGQSWNSGYRYIALLQVVLTAVLLFSLPLWQKKGKEEKITEETKIGAENESTEGAEMAASAKVSAEEPAPAQSMGLLQAMKIPGAKEIMITFFCYCALEQTTGLWASSYLVLHSGMTSEQAASLASLFFIGITGGRAASGFLTMKLNDTQMVRLGQGIILLGTAALLLPLGQSVAMAGLVLIGLGCAPIYPSIIHSTPEHFGKERSQTMIGIQMASAYVGTCLMPPIFGLLANHIGAFLFPWYLLAILLCMTFSHQLVLKRTAKKAKYQQNAAPQAVV